MTQPGIAPCNRRGQGKEKKRWIVIARIVLGVLLLILGVLGLFLPILQGLLFLAAGIALLADHIPLVARWRTAFFRHYSRLRLGVHRWRRRTKSGTDKSNDPHNG